MRESKSKKEQKKKDGVERIDIKLSLFGKEDVML